MSGRKDRRGPQGRTEPTLGNLDDLHRPAGTSRQRWTICRAWPSMRPGAGAVRRAARPAPRRRCRAVERRGWLIPLALLLLVGSITVLWLNQDALRGLVPRTDFNDVLTRATTALQGRPSGRLRRHQRARAVPGRTRAGAGQRPRAGRPARGRPGRAGAGAAAARRPDSSTRRHVRRRPRANCLAAAATSTRSIAPLRRRAPPTCIRTTWSTARGRRWPTGRLDGDDGAGALFARVLGTDPDNAVAAHGLDQVGGAYAAQARKALDAGDARRAGALIDKLATLLPRYGDLPSLRAAQAQAQRQHDDALNQALSQGMDALRAGRITGDWRRHRAGLFPAGAGARPGQRRRPRRHRQGGAGADRAGQCDDRQRRHGPGRPVARPGAGAGAEVGRSCCGAGAPEGRRHALPRGGSERRRPAHRAGAARGSDEAATVAMPARRCRRSRAPQVAQLVQQAQAAAQTRRHHAAAGAERLRPLPQRAGHRRQQRSRRARACRDLPSLVVAAFNQALPDGNLGQGRRHAGQPVRPGAGRSAAWPLAPAAGHAPGWIAPSSSSTAAIVPVRRSRSIRCARSPRSIRACRSCRCAWRAGGEGMTRARARGQQPDRPFPAAAPGRSVARACWRSAGRARA